MGTDTAPLLPTGWECDQPVGDTLLRRFLHGWAGALTDPVARSGGRVVREDAFAICDLGRPGSFFTSVVLLQPPGPDGWDAVLDDVERRVFRDGTGEVHLWSAWPTPDLSARSWSLAGHPPVLFRPPGGPLPHPCGGPRGARGGGPGRARGVAAGGRRGLPPRRPAGPRDAAAVRARGARRRDARLAGSRRRRTGRRVRVVRRRGPARPASSAWSAPRTAAAATGGRCCGPAWRPVPTCRAPRFSATSAAPGRSGTGSGRSRG